MNKPCDRLEMLLCRNQHYAISVKPDGQIFVLLIVETRWRVNNTISRSTPGDPFIPPFFHSSIVTLFFGGLPIMFFRIWQKALSPQNRHVCRIDFPNVQNIFWRNTSFLASCWKIWLIKIMLCLCSPSYFSPLQLLSFLFLGAKKLSFPDSSILWYEKGFGAEEDCFGNAKSLSQTHKKMFFFCWLSIIWSERTLCILPWRSIDFSHFCDCHILSYYKLSRVAKPLKMRTRACVELTCDFFSAFRGQFSKKNLN